MTCQATGSCHRHLPQPETETVRARNQHIYEISNQNDSFESQNSKLSSKPIRKLHVWHKGKLRNSKDQDLQQVTCATPVWQFNTTAGMYMHMSIFMPFLSFTITIWIWKMSIWHRKEFPQVRTCTALKKWHTISLDQCVCHSSCTDPPSRQGVVAHLPNINKRFYSLAL